LIEQDQSILHEMTMTLDDTVDVKGDRNISINDEGANFWWTTFAVVMAVMPLCLLSL